MATQVKSDLCRHAGVWRGRVVHANVPVLAIKNARNGRVRLRKAGYLAEAAMTPRVPAAVPAAPPIRPPVIVAL